MDRKQSRRLYGSIDAWDIDNSYAIYNETTRRYEHVCARYFVFDFFDQLAEGAPASPDYSILRAAYCREEVDSHPNQLANETVGTAFTKVVKDAKCSYQAMGERQE